MARQSIILTFDVEGLYGNADRELKRILEELSRYDAYATFFFVASYAGRLRETVKMILDGGHEIGCHGYNHTRLTILPKNEIEKSLRKASIVLTDLCRTSIYGFRAPDFLINEKIIRILEDMGYEYDSSVVPCVSILGRYGFPRAPIYPYHPSITSLEKTEDERSFWEIPLAVFPGVRLPCFGGWWLKNLGMNWFSNGLKFLLRRGPATLCFHDWEFLEARDIRVPANLKRSSIPYFAFRNTGTHMLKALIHVLKESDAKCLSVRRVFERGLLL